MTSWSGREDLRARPFAAARARWRRCWRPAGGGFPCRLSPRGLRHWDGTGRRPRAKPRSRRRGPDAEAARPPTSRAQEGRLVEMEGRPADDRRGDDLRAGRPSGRRATFIPTSPFAVWDGNELVPFTKAYSGLTDAEFGEITRWVRKNTLQRFGPVRQVAPSTSSRSPSRASRKAPATSRASRCAFPAWPAGAATSPWPRPTRSTTSRRCSRNMDDLSQGGRNSFVRNGSLMVPILWE
jgi:DNA ligase-1